jgi:hypothetical protein
LFIALLLPQTSVGAQNNGLEWGLEENSTLEYSLDYYEYSYNTNSFNTTQSYSLRINIRYLPAIMDDVKALDDIPAPQIDWYGQDSTLIELENLVWIPEWFQSWRPVCLVLPIGNQELLENVINEKGPPEGYSISRVLNETSDSWGFNNTLEGMGFLIQMKEVYSNYDGSVLEYSFLYDDLFLQSSFSLQRINLQGGMDPFSLDIDILISSVLVGQFSVIIVLTMAYVKIRNTVKKVKSR